MKARSDIVRTAALPSASTLLALVKFRLLTLVLVSTCMGWFLGARAGSALLVLAATLSGVALVGGGANCLNQWKERHADGQMLRTRTRPLVTGRISPTATLVFGSVISLAGMLILAGWVNLLTAVLSLLSWASYLFVYTPLKQTTPFNTWVGAVPGALPAVLGYSGASNTLDATALAVFLLLYVWQLPHFFAISWVYRDDYLRGGFRMLSWNDPQGQRSARHILVHSVLLLPASSALYLVGANGLIYLGVALASGLVQLHLAWRFWRQPDTARARRVFHFSIIYLPVLFLGIVLDHILLL
jgi:protoheme IX farnesyltransferase